MDISFFRSLFYPNIDDIVFRVALEYENLYLGQNLKLDIRNFSSTLSTTKRRAILAKNGISYLKKDSSDYIIYLIIRSNKTDYYEGIMAGRNFRLKGDLIAFTGPPMRLRYKNHKNPSIYSSEEVCYNSSGRWERLNIRWNYWYNSTNQDTTFKIARWLEQGKLVLQK